MKNQPLPFQQVVFNSLLEPIGNREAVSRGDINIAAAQTLGKLNKALTNQPLQFQQMVINNLFKVFLDIDFLGEAIPLKKKVLNRAFLHMDFNDEYAIPQILGSLSEVLKNQPPHFQQAVLNSLLEDHEYMFAGLNAQTLENLSEVLKNQPLQFQEEIFNKLFKILEDEVSDRSIRRQAGETISNLSHILKNQTLQFQQQVFNNLQKLLNNRDINFHAVHVLTYLSEVLKNQPQKFQQEVLNNLLKILKNSDYSFTELTARALVNLSGLLKKQPWQFQQQVFNSLLKRLEDYDKDARQLVSDTLGKLFSTTNLFSQLEYWCGTDFEYAMMANSWDSQIAYHLFQHLDKPHQAMMACVSHQASFWHQSYLQQKQAQAENQALALFQPGAGLESQSQPHENEAQNYFAKFSYI